MNIDELYWYNRGFNDALRKFIDESEANLITEMQSKVKMLEDECASLRSELSELSN